MIRQKTYRYISILLLSCLALPLSAQSQAPANSEKQEKAPLIGGAAVGVDLCGLSMKAVGAKFANMEVMGRFNFREKYFPIAELGIGDCTREGSDNSNKFSTTAPYFRVGVDYNFNKKLNGNRFFGGLRYGFSSFKYDMTNDSFQDPVYGTTTNLDLSNLKSKNQWLEIVVGLEAKLWSIVRLGWSIRFKSKISQKASEYGEPYFIPGFGKQGTNCWGGTVNLVFDVGKSMKSGKKKHITTPPSAENVNVPDSTAVSQPEAKAEQKRNAAREAEKENKK